MAGTLTSDVLDAQPDENGTVFKDAAQLAGYGAESHKVQALPGPTVQTTLLKKSHPRCQLIGTARPVAGCRLS